MDQFISRKQRYWVVCKNGWVKLETLSFTRKEAIAAFIQSHTLAWDECKLYGWRTMKIELSIEEAKG